MRGNNRKSIEKCRKRLSQFTTMNVIDGQAGLVIYSSLIFYSLTIDNILNIIVLLILAVVSIAILTGDNGLLTKASEAKIMTALGAVKEEIELDRTANLMDNKNVTVEQLLADGKIKRTVQAESKTYYMYYAIKPDAYQGMQGLGKGNAAALKDVFLIDDEFHVRYIDTSGKEYGDEIEEKILEDETEIRFASQAFSEYISKISGVTETEMKFKWMKNQTSLTIADSSIDSLEDLVFFPNLTNLQLGEYGANIPPITTLDGVENCTKLTTIVIVKGPDKDYTALASLQKLTNVTRAYGSNSDYENIIDVLKFCNSLENLNMRNNSITDISKIGELGDLIALNLNNNQITKIEGLENLSNLKSLDLGNNQITDITPLSTNISLTGLNLKGNTGIDGNRSNYTGERLEALNKIGEILDRNGTISIDVDKLGLFTNYKSLDLSGQSLTTLGALEGLTALTSLNLENNQLTLEDEKSQEILKSMTNLTSLNLQNNKITDATAINELKNLKSLGLKGTENQINLVEIEDIISNCGLTVSTETFKTIVNCDVNKITKLVLNTSGLAEIPDLSKFTNLIELNLRNNNIKDLSTISKLTSLQSLTLTYTELHGRMIDFSKLTSLTFLNLSDNTLWTEDLENLKALRNIKNLSLNLNNNSIIDASALLVLDTSCKIDLRNNVNLTQESKEALKARFGSNISF